MSYQVDFEPLGRRLRVDRGVSPLTAAQQAIEHGLVLGQVYDQVTGIESWWGA